MNRTKKKLRRTNPARILVFIIFLTYALSMVYALFWAVTASLNEHIPLILNGLALPEKLHFENYIKAFDILEAANSSFVKMLWNTVWLAVVNSLISLASMTVTAYVLGRYEFKGKKIIITIMLAALLIPVYGSGSALLKMYIRLGMYDSPFIVLYSASALGSMTFVLKTFFESIPTAYEESAKLDGASRMKIFTRIHIPMVLPSIFSIFILQFIGAWNNYSLSIYYLPSYPTIASGLYIYETVSKFAMDKPAFFAGVVMCAIPPMIVFALFSDKLMTNISIGGLK